MGRRGYNDNPNIKINQQPSKGKEHIHVIIIIIIVVVVVVSCTAQKTTNNYGNHRKRNSESFVIGKIGPFGQ
jgi:flagellar basal body-associated protein FliL